MNDDEGADDFVRMMVHEACPKAPSIQEIQEATETGESLGKAKEALALKQWKLFLEGTKALTCIEEETRNQLWRVQNELRASERVCFSGAGSLWCCKAYGPEWGLTPMITEEPSLKLWSKVSMDF
ncbi:hypothetical protein NDU88_002036 [Pleurodeles waltl]|uniref:Uncharacterized protein n=1 Tax=Pleurodeles waltl TaxID=8319 RepID=A0AAV7T0U0_PLEWA|nr:hypothetical protein NDU88_002036 [Pleurodeles waltl]